MNLTLKNPYIVSLISFLTSLFLISILTMLLWIVNIVEPFNIIKLTTWFISNFVAGLLIGFLYGRKTLNLFSVDRSFAHNLRLGYFIWFTLYLLITTYLIKLNILEGIYLGLHPLALLYISLFINLIALNIGNKLYFKMK